MNPAVSLAVLVGRKRFDKIHFFGLSVVCQFLGALLGVFLGKAGGYGVPYLGVNEWANFNEWDAAWAEIWCSFVFCLVVLCVTDRHTRTSDDLGWNGLAMTLAYYAARTMAHCGASPGSTLNPAVSFNMIVWGNMLSDIP